MEALNAAIDADLAWAESFGVADVSHRYADLPELGEPAFEDAVYTIATRFRLDEAPVRRVAVQLARERFGVESPETLLQWVLLISAVGELQRAREEPEWDAAQRLEAAAALLEGADAPMALFDAWVTLGDWATDRSVSAAWYRRAMDAAAADDQFPRPSASTTLDAVLTAAWVGDVPWALGALAFGRQALAEGRESAPAERDALALAEAMIFEVAGLWEHAHRAAERARTAARRKSGPWAALTIDALTIEAQSLFHLGRPADAKRLLEPYLAEHRKDRRAPYAAGARIALLLADALTALGRADDGAALRERTIERLRGMDGEWEQIVLADATSSREA